MPHHTPTCVKRWATHVGMRIVSFRRVRSSDRVLFPAHANQSAFFNIALCASKLEAARAWYIIGVKFISPAALLSCAAAATSAIFFSLPSIWLGTKATSFLRATLACSRVLYSLLCIGGRARCPHSQGLASLIFYNKNYQAWNIYMARTWAETRRRVLSECRITKYHILALRKCEDNMLQTKLEIRSQQDFNFIVGVYLFICIFTNLKQKYNTQEGWYEYLNRSKIVYPFHILEFKQKVSVKQLTNIFDCFWIAVL
jgi:hypothetical protein